jgi:hypothetical protein
MGAKVSKNQSGFILSFVTNFPSSLVVGQTEPQVLLLGEYALTALLDGETTAMD